MMKETEVVAPGFSVSVVRESSSCPVRLIAVVGRHSVSDSMGSNRAQQPAEAHVATWPFSPGVRAVRTRRSSALIRIHITSKQDDGRRAGSAQFASSAQPGPITGLQQRGYAVMPAAQTRTSAARDAEPAICESAPKARRILLCSGTRVC
jgi:hypothetical protein